MRRKYHLFPLFFLLFILFFSGAARAEWAPACHGQIPPGASPQGHEANGDRLWVARAQLSSNGRFAGVHPGKVRPSFGGANIPYAGREIQARCYDVWIGPAHWIPASEGNIPRCAIPAGKEANGEPLFVARVRFKNGVHIGKVRPGLSGANIPYGGKELSFKNYEVMCR